MAMDLKVWCFWNHISYQITSTADHEIFHEHFIFVQFLQIQVNVNLNNMKTSMLIHIYIIH
jgi:hypothetical protein